MLPSSERSGPERGVVGGLQRLAGRDAMPLTKLCDSRPMTERWTADITDVVNLPEYDPPCSQSLPPDHSSVTNLPAHVGTVKVRLVSSTVACWKVLILQRRQGQDRNQGREEKGLTACRSVMTRPDELLVRTGALARRDVRLHSRWSVCALLRCFCHQPRQRCPAAVDPCQLEEEEPS